MLRSRMTSVNTVVSTVKLSSFLATINCIMLYTLNKHLPIEVNYKPAFPYRYSAADSVNIIVPLK